MSLLKMGALCEDAINLSAKGLAEGSAKSRAACTWIDMPKLIKWSAI